MLGAPFLANLQDFPWIPTRLILLFFDPLAAYAVGVAIAAALAALFTYLFSKRAGLSEIGAVTAGWTFACAGFFASRVMAGHLPLLEAYPSNLVENGENVDEALTLAQRAVQKLNNNPNASDTLGWVYLKKNQLDGALQIFRTLVDKNPDNPIFHYHVGAALAAKGAVLQVSPRNRSSQKRGRPGNSGGHFEEFVDEPILTPDAMSAQPPHLALPNDVHRLIAPNRSFAQPGIRETLAWRSLAV